MSLIEKLTKVVDPAEARRREEEARRKEGEHPPRTDGSDPPHAYECRVCGHVGDEEAYCPTCLAETMQKIR
jgi:rubrerythrin